MKQLNEERFLDDNGRLEQWPLLRRELYDGGYLDREQDGSRYWLVAKSSIEEQV